MTIVYVIIAILFFGVLVVDHEFGHFSVAKLCNIRVDEFSVGMGPALLQKQKGETLYSLRAIPFGGYCAFGEDDGESEDERAYINQPVWKKLLVLCAGSFNNFVLGFLMVLILVIIWNFGEAGFLRLVSHSWDLTLEMCSLVWESLGMLFSGEAGINDLAGPVGIVDVMTDVAEESPNVSEAFSNLTYFGAFISVNLAIMNMLPIPALDGGRIFSLLVTSLIELITGKKLDPKYEGYVHTAGTMLLLGLMVYILFRDVIRVFFNG